MLTRLYYSTLKTCALPHQGVIKDIRVCSRKFIHLRATYCHPRKISRAEHTPHVHRYVALLAPAALLSGRFQFPPAHHAYGYLLTEFQHHLPMRSVCHVCCHLSVRSTSFSGVHLPPAACGHPFRHCSPHVRGMCSLCCPIADVLHVCAPRLSHFSSCPLLSVRVGWA